MSKQGNGQPQLYRLSISAQVRAALKQLHLDAAQRGVGHEFLAALKQIGERLRREPLGFGEPLYHLPALKLVVCQGALAPLLVDFAVNEEQAVVFIRGFRLLA